MEEKREEEKPQKNGHNLELKRQRSLGGCWVGELRAAPAARQRARPVGWPRTQSGSLGFMAFANIQSMEATFFQVLDGGSLGRRPGLARPAKASGSPCSISPPLPLLLPLLLRSRLQVSGSAVQQRPIVPQFSPTPAAPPPHHNDPIQTNSWPSNCGSNSTAQTTFSSHFFRLTFVFWMIFCVMYRYVKIVLDLFSISQCRGFWFDMSEQYLNASWFCVRYFWWILNFVRIVLWLQLFLRCTDPK